MPKKIAISLIFVITLSISVPGYCYLNHSNGNAFNIDQNEILIPEFPFWNNNLLKIDEDLILELASEYIDENGEDISIQEFLLGYLPLKSVDRLGSGMKDKSEVGKLLGNLYLSGYFGGVWLRDVLNITGEGAEEETKGFVQETLGSFIAFIKGEIEHAVFNALVNITNAIVELSINGNSSDVLSANKLSISPFLVLYGYNWGYYNYIINNPPEGMEPPEDVLIANRFLDCSMENIEFDTLNKFKPVLDELYSITFQDLLTPSGRRWLELRTEVELFGKGAVRMGEGVWGILMSLSAMNDPGTFSLLVDLSARFMLVAEVALLPSMLAHAEQDAEAGRCGLLEETAMMIWAGSYFMGLLLSSVPRGSFPEISILS